MGDYKKEFIFMNVWPLLNYILMSYMYFQNVYFYIGCLVNCITFSLNQKMFNLFSKGYTEI